MVFSTIVFLCAFLPITIIGYYCMPKALKNYFQLAMSLFFYAWGEPRAVFVMLGSILCNYLLGLGIPYVKGKDENGGGLAKLLLAAGVLLNIGILFAFKYLAFTTETLHRLSSRIPVLSIALPIGISFYTFQGLSYVIDVYRGEKAQKNPFTLALYISMFPQLIAGPIVRYHDVCKSLSERTHSFEIFSEGICRFTRGLAKKVILANQMGALADQIFGGDYAVMGCSVAWLGTLAYTLQIFLDFSGYSDMAIGLGKMFGFHFAENFNLPYCSTSVREFWRRWHISLSGWFRDYLYIPLGGSRKGNVYLHLFLVFLATGIWHGAGWGFLIWGLWHGLFVILERLVSAKRTKSSMKDDRPVDAAKEGSKAGSILKKGAGWCYTMLVVMLGWTLFRIVEIGPFFDYLKALFGLRKGSFTAFSIGYYLTHQRIFYLALSILVCTPLTKKLPKLWNNKVLILLLLAICYIFMINSTYNPFIYFRF